jgi:hypothetical protein
MFFKLSLICSNYKDEMEFNDEIKDYIIDEKKDDYFRLNQ